MPNAYGSPDEQLAAHFDAWERRGRGWDLYTDPVELEPPFRPFPGHYVWQPPPVDDTRKPRLVDWLFRRRLPAPEPLPDARLIDPEEPVPQAVALPSEVSELRVLLPDAFDLRHDAAEQLLLALRFCSTPISFELIATASRISLQFALSKSESAQILTQLQAFAPAASICASFDVLSNAWFQGEGESLVVDLGLSDAFMRPIRTARSLSVDPLVALIGVLGTLREDEVAAFQVLFQAAAAPWSTSILAAVVDAHGEPFFVTGAEGVKQAAAKVSKPLYAVRPRLAIRAKEHDRRLQLLRAVMGALSQFEQPGSNELLALDREGWEEASQIDDLLFRQAHRPGMLLNVEELAALVHLPSAQVVNAKFERHNKRSKEAPPVVRGRGVFIGRNEHAGAIVDVNLPAHLRSRHTYVIGGTGTGKSTLLLTLILQDIEAGHGVAVLDPHGDLVDSILARLPERRIPDVVLINPADEEFPVGLNILTAHSEVEKTLLSSDLISVFRRLSTSWGDQMNAVLGNAILAFLESTEGGTLLELRRFLVDKEFRKAFLLTVQDSEVVYFWEKEFPQLIGRAAAPLLTRLDTFLRPKLIRHMVAQRRSLDFRRVIDHQKILLAKLSQGAIGEENSYLLGTLIVSKLHQVALSRADIDAALRKDFFLYVDEFHHFITPSMVSLLSGVRKYHLGLTLAHQHLSQLGDSRDELTGGATRICFHLEDADARYLADGFSFFERRDLQNLGVGEAIVRVERAENDFNLRTVPLPALDTSVAQERTLAVVQSSRERFATPKADVEQATTPSPAALRPPTAQAEPAAPPPSQSRAEPVAPVPHPVQPALRPAAETGRGGEQHRYLQKLIQGLGEARGFRVSLEVPVLSGTGNADVVLERDGLSVACEITVTTSTGHEVGNLQKCLAAGYGRVVLVSPTQRNLSRVRKRAVAVFAPDDLARIHFALPEAIPELLDQMGVPSPRTETVKGYTVKVAFNSPVDDQTSARTERLRDILRKTLRRERAE